MSAELSQKQGNRGGIAFVYAAALALIAVFLYMQFMRGNGGDKNFRLLMTHLWLEGRPLYSGTYIDVNLPLSIWLYSLPLRLAELFSLKDYYALVLFGTCFVAWSILLSLRLIAYHPQFQDPDRRNAFLILLGFLFICFPSTSWFFEREHIFLVCAMPYILRWMPSLGLAPLPRSLKVQVGALAALGFCIKPHCIIPFAGIQLMFLLQQKRLRILFSIENAIVYLAAAVYAGSVYLFMPDYWRIVLPMAMATYRSTQDYMDGRMIFMALALFTFSLTFVDFRWRLTSPYRRDIYYLLGLCPFMVVYIIVNNGWTTTYYPLMGVLLLLSAMVGWEAHWLESEYVRQGLPAKCFRFCYRACIIALLLNALWVLPRPYSYFTFRCSDHIECRVDHELMKEVRGKDGRTLTFGTMSSVYGRWIELNRSTGAKLETRFHHLWMLTKFELSDPGFYRTQEWILRYLAEAYASDIGTRKPDVIFVDDFDLLSLDGKQVTLPVFFSCYPDFKQAWLPYRFDHVIDYCTSYLHDRPGCRFDAYMRAQP